jgi:hypothetical protein
MRAAHAAHGLEVDRGMLVRTRFGVGYRYRSQLSQAGRYWAAYYRYRSGDYVGVVWPEWEGGRSRPVYYWSTRDGHPEPDDADPARRCDTHWRALLALCEATRSPLVWEASDAR